MTVEELYAQVGGDYAEALSRLRSDKLVERFILKFPSDGSCSALIDAWGAGDEQAAFEAAHMAKGVCANLSLTKLAVLADEITEALRPGNDDVRAKTDVDALVSQLGEAYRVAVEAIEAYSDGR